MTDVPEPPPPGPPEPRREPPLGADAPSASPRPRPQWVLPLAIGGGVAIALLLVFFVWKTQFSGAPDPSQYTVEAYTPPTELISARDRIPGRAAPDEASQVAVEFGPGVTLNVTGRVSRGLGNDWYAVAWNNQTVFVRAGDAIAGSGAPPTPEVRERQKQEIPEEEEDEIKNPFEEDEIVEASPTPSGTLDIGDVDWIREPSARDFARFYPDQALDDERSGRVTLDCEIGGNGRLSCSVASESPSGYGFGQAALGISRQLRVQPTLPDGSSAAGRHLRLPLSFRAG